MSTHHFLIHDNDSETNFVLSELPVKFACGYRFCDHQEPSTLSQISEGSEKSQKAFNFRHKESHYSKDDMAGSEKLMQNRVYYESAIRKHLANMETAYTEHKIDAAFMEAQKLKKLCEKNGHKLAPAQRKFLDQIEQEMHDVEMNQKILKQDDWQLKKQKKNIRVSSKIEGNTVGVLVQAFLDVAIQKFLAILTEIDLMKKWMPFMKSSSLEKIVSRNCRIGHCINNFPILSNRQSFFQGIGYDRMDHNKTVFMYTRSLNERKDLQKQLGYEVHETEGTVQLDYKYLIIEYKPDTPVTGTLKMAINVDMKLQIPMFILEPATTGFGIDFYTNVLETAKNFKGSEWEKKVQKNSAFFDFVQQRIKIYFYQQAK